MIWRESLFTKRGKVPRMLIFNISLYSPAIGIEHEQD